MKNASIPTASIEWIVNRLHVSVSDDEIATDMRRRIRINPGVTDAIEKRVVAYALKCHHKNQDLYRAVVNGRQTCSPNKTANFSPPAALHANPRQHRAK